MSGAVPASVDDRFIEELVVRAESEGLKLTGEGGLLQQLTKRLLESALEGEMTDHLVMTGTIRQGRTAATHATASGPRPSSPTSGPVQIEVPRDLEGALEPQIGRKRQRRLTGGDEPTRSTRRLHCLRPADREPAQGDGQAVLRPRDRPSVHPTPRHPGVAHVQLEYGVRLTGPPPGFTG
ncbi:transposase [Streptomyces sp. NPDC127084]|uniref:transposase n=1 Tax=Streptomyces sp. NPDC127084 TaxID=3347133 RepID=UPI00365458AE